MLGGAVRFRRKKGRRNVKKDARQWGVFVILLAAVLASGDGGATSVLLRQDSAHMDNEATHFPLRLPDTMRGLTLPDEFPSMLPNTFLADWSIAPPEKQLFGTMTPAVALPTAPKGEASTTTHYQTSRLSLSEREMAVWKSNGEPEDWLFRMQFAKASIYEAPKPSPLIPIPEPATGLLVLVGMVGRLAWGSAWRTGRNRAGSH